MLAELLTAVADVSAATVADDVRDARSEVLLM